MDFEIAGSDGRPLRGTEHGPADGPVVLVLHGFKGFAAWGMFPWIADRLADAGFRAVRFDFSHNGVEARDFDRLDLFLLDTWTRHQEDLDAVAARHPGPIALLGHSRGGADALLFAARTPRVAATVTLAAVADTMVPDDLEAVIRRHGYYPVPNARTGQTMPMARTAFEDARRHDVGAAAAALGTPLLLIHGEDDASVPLSHLERLRARAPDAEVLRVPGAGHTFGAVHPFEGPTPQLERATDAAVAFLRRHHQPA